MTHTLRLVAGVAVLAAAASLAGSAQAAGSSPTVQARELAGAQSTFAAAESAVDTKLEQAQTQANGTADCGTVSQSIPKSDKGTAFGIFFSWVIVHGAEAIAPVYVTHDRDVAALRLTDPALSQYATALHKLATVMAPLQSAKPVSMCTALDRWGQDGYPTSGTKFAASIFGLTTAQARATDFAGDSKALTVAKTAADARMRALGVTPVPFQPSSA